MSELQPQALRRLNKHEFDRFCRRLLDAEYEERFEPETVTLEGPPPVDVGDGGRDLRAVVSSEPVEKSHWSLLPSRPCEVWYSCKSHKDDGRERSPPSGWWGQVLDDLDPGKRLVDARTGELRVDADARSETKRALPRELLDLLAKGGRYVVLVNVEAEKQPERERELRVLFDFWLTKHDLHVSLHDDAVQIRDANHLARVFDARNLSLPPGLARKLQVDEPLFVFDWQQWTKRYTRDRRDMKWQPDAPRRALAAKLQAFLTNHHADNVFRLWGPPGVGKTRLVHQVMGEAGVRDRVRFSEEVQDVRRWLGDRHTSLSKDLLLVVDEVPALEASALAKDFRSYAPASAKLMIIGPQELGHEGRPTPEQLDRLGDEETRAILRDEMGPDDARIDLALGLCRGYPLFAYWLGEALAKDVGLLADPKAALTDDDDPWDATCAVLVGPRGSDEQRWRDQATNRAKALVLASATADHPWSRLETSQRQAFEELLGLSWVELEQAAVECQNRSLLRVHGELRYVSPANLERLVLNHFFSDKGPGGPPLDPQRFARRLGSLFSGLLNRAQAVHASDSCKRNLSRGALREIESATRTRDSKWLSEAASLLRVASFLVPQDAVGTIEEVVMGADVGADSALMNQLAWSLGHISHRQISARTFERVEALLFDLVRISTGSESSGRRLWVALFDPAFHLTRQPFEHRLALLQRRLHDEDPRTRALAVEALDFGARSPGWLIGWDDVDGPWEHEQLPQPIYFARIEQLWSALLEVATDAVERVCSRARLAIAGNLRLGINRGLTPTHLERLVELIPSWTLEERERLAEQVDDVVRYDLDSLRERDEMREAFSRLHAAVAPGDLDERVVAQVGRWHPGPWPINAEGRAQLERERDEELARELLAALSQLERILPWLGSSKAVRARAFAHALGRHDESLSAFERLRDGAPHSFTAAYLAGWLDVVKDAVFDDWLEAAREELPPELLASVLTTVVANDRRGQLLVELLRTPAPMRALTAGFGTFLPWAEKLSSRVLDELLVGLAARRDDASSREGLGLLAGRLQRDAGELGPELRTAAHELLARPSSSPSSIVARGWTSAVISLAQRDDWQPLANALDRALTASTYPHHLVDTLRAAADAGIQDRMWPLVARALTDNSNADLEWLARIIADAHVIEDVSPRLVLEWIGDDPRRARLTASMLTPLRGKPSQLARALVARFGADSEVGEELDVRRASG